MKKFLKFSTYFLGAILTIIIIILVGLAVYDSIRMNRLESKVAQLKLGDLREKAIQLLGEPNASWGKGDSKFTLLGKQEYYENSGMAYGENMDWENALHPDFPYFFPFKFRLFGPDGDDIVIYLDDQGLVLNIEMPN